MLWFDPAYLLFALPGFVLALFASMFVRKRFAHYSKVSSANGLTGAEAADLMLRRAGVTGVRIERVQGFLSDHYDPQQRLLRLSPSVYGSSSLAALGVACHEAGHALQHATGYAFLGLRSALVPMTNLGSSLSYVVVTLGFFMHSQPLILLGAALFSLAVVFALVTLPVEWDASARAKVAMIQTGVVTAAEGQAAGKVLNAAFMTYVASAVNALLILLYYLMRAGVFRRND